MNNAEQARENKILALFNELKDADRLTELLDPRGKLRETRSIVETILAHKSSRSGKAFTQFGELQELFVDQNVFDRFSEVVDQAPCITHPILLLPVRLETRFTADKLLVRFYPDQIFFHSHDNTITNAEYEAGKYYRDSSAAEKKDAWRMLSSRFGPRRAAWIAHKAESADFAPDAKETHRMIMPNLEALPDRFWVFAYRDGKLIGDPTPGAPIRTDASVFRMFNKKNQTLSEQRLFDDNSKWMHDFATALEEGFAVEIGLSPQDLLNKEGFDRLVAVGIKNLNPAQGAEQLEELLNAHHYSDGLGFVAPGSPTNNTGESISAFSSREDHDASFTIEQEVPRNWSDSRTNAYRLAEALGIAPEIFRNIEGAGSVDESYAKEMNTVLWTVTGDYYFRGLLPGLASEDYLEGARLHVENFVRGGGPLPTLRIGRQPYGVLPVTRIPGTDQDDLGWAFCGFDSPSVQSDTMIHKVVSGLFEKWLQYAEDSKRVPRVGVEGEDPDEVLLRILSMEPNCVTFKARPYVDERFIAFLIAVLRDYAFGPGTAYEASGLTPVEWMARWGTTWDEIQERIASFLAALGGSDDLSAFAVTPYPAADNAAATAEVKPLLKILAWGEGLDAPTEMVIDPNEDGKSPAEYLAELGQSGTTNTDTLLADMCKRALQLSEAQSPDLHEKVKNSITALSTNSVLSFLNGVAEPLDLVRQIKNDPAMSSKQKGRSITMKLAADILAERERLGGRFGNLAEIQSIPGIDSELLHGIAYSAAGTSEARDLERLFRESLDIASHRVDAWVTSFATKRLQGMRERSEGKNGIYLGAYGFVEDLNPRDDLISEGYIHGPSANHAAAAAVLYNAYLTHKPVAASGGADPATNPFNINLTSQRVRHALRILEGIRQGQALGALLGYEFERALVEAERPLEQYIDDFRAMFPMVAHKLTDDINNQPAEAVAARNVVDGAALIRNFNGEPAARQQLDDFLSSTGTLQNDLLEVIQKVADSLDAAGDLMLTESVYQAVQGNYARAGAALEAASGNLPPPELESVDTPVPGRTLTHRIGLLFNDALWFPLGHDIYSDPRGAAEPRISAWFASALGPMENIGVEFEFWEEETDPAILARVNVNTATVEQLATLPGIGADQAKAIVKERNGEGGPFRRIDDLRRVAGIDAKKIAMLRPSITTGYVERVDLNQASSAELRALPVLTDSLAKNILSARETAPFKSIDDLAGIAGMDAGLIQNLRPQVTTGFSSFGLNELGLSAADFLYIAQAVPGGGETEIEQRIARIVREKFALPAAQRIAVHPKGKGDFEYGLEDAVELANRALTLLAAGTPMSPETLCHPGDVATEGYSHADLEALRDRAVNAQGWAIGLLKKFEFVPQTIHFTIEVQVPIRDELRLAAGSKVVHRPTNTQWETRDEIVIRRGGVAQGSAHCQGPMVSAPPSTDWFLLSPSWTMSSPDMTHFIVPVKITTHDEPEIAVSEPLADLLEKAARFGIPGAFPPASDDPSIRNRFKNTGDELRRRVDASSKLISEAAAAGHAKSAADLYLKAFRAIFGRSFIALPTFVPSQQATPEDALNKALTQKDLLNGLGEERLRLWFQQVSAVREAVAKLDDVLMMAEAWAQGRPAFAMKLAQLPYTPERKWLGLSIEEGAEKEPKPDWARSPLSLALFSHGELPDFSTKAVTAGILVDQWDELIPAPIVNTSVAYHYDAPSTQAPQALLLAVPAQMNNMNAPWTPEALAAIVNDTADLAKVRAVDIDALVADANQPEDSPVEPVGAVLPGIFLPVEPVGWPADAVNKTIEDYFDVLVDKVQFSELNNLDLQGQTEFTLKGYKFSVPAVPEPPSNSDYFLIGDLSYLYVVEGTPGTPGHPILLQESKVLICWGYPTICFPKPVSYICIISCLHYDAHVDVQEITSTFNFTLYDSNNQVINGGVSETETILQSGSDYRLLNSEGFNMTTVKTVKVKIRGSDISKLELTGNTSYNFINSIYSW